MPSIFSALFNRFSSSAAGPNQAMPTSSTTVPGQQQTQNVSFGVAAPVPNVGQAPHLIPISGHVSASQHVTITGNANVTAHLLPFEDGELISATATINIGPSNDGVVQFCWAKETGTTGAALYNSAYYKGMGFANRYGGVQHLLELPRGHVYGTSLKATNIGNKAPCLFIVITGTVTVYYDILIEYAPVGIAGP